MPTYKHSSGKRFLFVHIPRTAGRFLEENVKENEFELEQDDIWKSIDGIEKCTKLEHLNLSGAISLKHINSIVNFKKY